MASETKLTLLEGERIDSTGFGTIKVIQRKDFGYGVDSVLLAAFAMGETGAKPLCRLPGMSEPAIRIADLGTGNGIIAFIIAHKLGNLRLPAQILGFEKNEAAYDRACRAAKLNSLEDRVSFVCTDILDIDGKHDYDAILTNPPYFKRANTHSDASNHRFSSRHETTADISDFSRIASSMLRKGGDLYMVHRPDRLVDILTSLRQADLEPKEIQLVLPETCGQGALTGCQPKPANIVLIHAIKGGGAELKVLPTLAVHNQDGSYTWDILRIYERTT